MTEAPTGTTRDSAHTDFVTGRELSPEEVRTLIARAREMKEGRPETGAGALAGCSIALIFEKPSTRTRVSFEAGVHELGGHPIVLTGEALQLSRGESIADTARVMSRYVAAVVIRSGSHPDVVELAAASEVPVVNALTPELHPCQALADLMTLEERFGSLEGRKIAFVGDGNNVARSLAIAGDQLGVEVVVSSPEGYGLEGETPATLVDDPREAVEGADAVYGDVWVSMGDERTADARLSDFEPWRIDDSLMSAAGPDAVAMHCLPAHPGEEITAEVLYGPRSVVWDQAENRLHTQKALLEHLVG
ncbi:MAG: ornithine carbamoyltransferase [Solirubrobacterales bacterium]|nr:ornithine carbamoyltransferase [Solirubrobacterales bacterium]